ncbi:histidine kinase [Methylibium sp. Pch-M]|uniref:FecR family protein n=1 Tax=Methylibium sp. Pch-M TaxID=2082386 RepID=UPI001011B580|nr:FecR domain-containing protein [Methylibium sp. Pch-M]QAZ37946.1 histidine kinase [Methylibium sp. Pch-M]
MPSPSPSPDHPPTPAHGEDADELEFAAFVQAQDPLDIAAATWVARRRDGLDSAGEAELQVWLDADPRHAAVYDDMDATFGDLQQLPDDDLASLRAALAAQAPGTDLPPRTATPAAAAPAWRRWLHGIGRLVPRSAAAAGALALAGVGWTGWIGWEQWRQQPLFERSYTTARGQQLTVALPDAAGERVSKGSTLQLDTATRLEAHLYRDRREMHLKDGQALFAVHGDPARPLHVWAGPLRITVVGTRFAVRHTASGIDAGQTVVSVEEGRVRVARADRLADGHAAGASEQGEHGPAVELSAGQQVVVDPAGHIGPVASVPPAAIALWREGRVRFDQTPLAHAIAEFERYGPTGLVLRDPAVAALPVGGSYSLRQFQRFAQALPQVLPVRLVPLGNDMEVVAR